MATSLLVIETSKKKFKLLKRVPWIHYLLYFQKNTINIRALIDSSSEVNTMAPVYPSKLGLKVCHINVRGQKIDGSTPKMFGMVLASFQIEDKLGRTRFFQETFLLADIYAKVILGMPFFIFSNANIQFPKKRLTWKSYTIAKVLPTIKRVQFIIKKKFAKVVLDKNPKTFVVHVTSLVPILVHPDKEVQIASLPTKKVKIPDNYSDFVNVFSEKKILVLPEQIKSAIKLDKSKQPLYGQIYSLGPVEL